MSRLAPGQQYAGGCGERARRRYLRQAFQRAAALKDEASRAALDRARKAVDGDPDLEFAVQHLAHVAWLAAADTGATWARAMNHLLDGFERNATRGVLEPELPKLRIEVKSPSPGDIKVWLDDEEITCWIPIGLDKVFRAARPGQELDFQIYEHDSKGRYVFDRKTLKPATRAVMAVVS